MDQDLSVIRRMKRGDEQAVEEFVRKYYTPILHYCFRQTGCREDSEDLAQETFRRFFEHFGEYRHYGKALNYLYVIAGNLCRSLYREQKAHASVPLPDSDFDPAYGKPGGSAPPDPTGDAAARNTDLRTALGLLPEPFRDILILFYYQELKLSEISAVLGIKIPLAKYRLSRARALLRQIMEKEDEK